MANLIATKQCRQAKVPTKIGTGFEIYSLKDVLIQPNSWVVLETGIFLTIPKGYGFNIQTHFNHESGISVMNSPSVLQDTHEGEILVVLSNQSTNPFPFVVKAGDPIAIGVPFVIPDIDITESCPYLD